MPRTPEGLTAKTQFVTARWSESRVNTLDKLRGKGTAHEIPRSKYLEKLVIDEEKRRRST